MKLHILVEGVSEEKFLNGWLKRFLPKHSFKIYPHLGKGRIPGDPSLTPNPRLRGLLDQLPAKLRAFGKALNSDTERVLVLVDLDNDDCLELKKRMTDLTTYCDSAPTAKFRIAIEETEAFYLGDMKAIRTAYPKAKFEEMKSYIHDSICGTWELFRKVIGEHTEDKPKWAEQMGKHMTIEWKENQSPSFRKFCEAVLTLSGESY